MLKTFFVPEMLTFLSRPFGYVEKGLGKKAKVNDYNFFDATYQEANNYNTNIIKYLKKEANKQ